MHSTMFPLPTEYTSDEFRRVPAHHVIESVTLIISKKEYINLPEY